MTFDINSLLFFTKNDPQLLFSVRLNSINRNSDNDWLYLSIIKSILSKQTGDEFALTIFSFDSSKYYILNSRQSNVLVFGNFSKRTKSSIIKVFLIHILNAFHNFLDSKINLLNAISITIKDYSRNDFIAKVFNAYLSFPLIQHFKNVTTTLFTKKTINLDKLYYEDFYLINLPSGDTVFNWKSVTNNSSESPNFHLKNNEMLWNELMVHSNILRDQYITKYKRVLDTTDYNDYFVKMEYTATYPKLIFVIKFLPILNGMALIHVYSRYRLSTNEDDIKNPYKEIDIFYANEVNKENGNIEYRYKEPKSLRDIENFFIEYFTRCNDSYGCFSSNKNELKYIDISILNIINKSIVLDEDNKNKIDFDKSFKAINSNLYKEYKNTQDNNTELKKGTRSPKKHHSKTLVRSKTNLYLNQPAYFQLTPNYQLKELFTVLLLEDNGNDDKDKSKDDITICLPKRGDKSNEESFKEQFNKLLDNDITIMSKCYIDTHWDINDKSASIERSLFDVDLTIIKPREINNGGNDDDNDNREITKNDRFALNNNKPIIISLTKNKTEEKIISNNDTENSNEDEYNNNNIIEHTSQIRTVYKANE